MTTSVQPAVSPSARQLAEGLAGAGGPARIVLAEGDDPRVQEAARLLPDLGVTPLLVLPAGADRRAVPSYAETLDVRALATGPAGKLVARIGADRGWPEDLVAQRRADPVYLAAALVRLGRADGAVAGSRRPTGDVLRAGLQVVGLDPGCATLSSSFLLALPSGQLLAFGDCAVVPEPDAGQLADIAVATAGTFAALTGERPSVAMLSFSTLGSAEHPAVSQVREATALARRQRPDLVIDGELQFDAALVESVAAAKAADSAVAGRANVFVFPNLAAGNIGYKIAQRLGGAEAFGPILQGLRVPLNDLSRGCSAGDVASVAVITALQALAPDRTPADRAQVLA
jgi:phosphotransacetylase